MSIGVGVQQLIVGANSAFDFATVDHGGRGHGSVCCRRGSIFWLLYSTMVFCREKHVTTVTILTGPSLVTGGGRGGDLRPLDHKYEMWN
jgi:hypothetical protein